MRARRLILRLAVVAALILTALAINTGRNVAGWVPLAETPDQRRAELAPAWRLVRPARPGPWPVAVLLSGCDGVQDNMDRWARFFAAQGRAALIVNSHRPRGLDRRQAWRAVCAGQVLTGGERAGDLAVAVAALENMGLRGDDVIVLGASHGGWTAMELMAQLADGDPPPGLTAWPEPPAQLAARISRLVLLYPYCGFASRAGGDWPAGVHGLMILAEEDRIVDPDACRAMAGQGLPLDVHILAGADHGFDQRSRSVLSPLRFNAAATAQAEALIGAFASPPQAGL
ncbi:MAG: dienelactone hydrolase family protein [Paracoccus sp. (in: a-proteobacteria)]|uniref:dienelactone hydrolase family protein n=1 Tax=Paracoccus sp. TaxID=267 RepID=UPI0026DF9BAE|nr:dienelactone hydrolase family protein [Paracoccus sp. (in: a-proteobacteria)]MDO5630833.1 dienelactone hydrolase family protein [Paracoccus sp. (in: a-proteobacteria)]